MPIYRSGRGPTPGWGLDFGCPNRRKQKNVFCRRFRLAEMAQRSWIFLSALSLSNHSVTASLTPAIVNLAPNKRSGQSFAHGSPSDFFLLPKANLRRGHNTCPSPSQGQSSVFKGGFEGRGGKLTGAAGKGEMASQRLPKSKQTDVREGGAARTRAPQSSVSR